ncbi:divergent polysaccharide deacetylase family protein [Thaumasiovibrio subtropicus]|uniref:divergent polysaccharide deacetylase family protein n=1 Tax=Thaumasiovibrio subtropicus TaxID=1891207 RepID=UPI000B3586FF|nr:divergent polysaccharide deacetylase family protein [Thaumasiovibrio subtropicus]
MLKWISHWHQLRFHTLLFILCWMSSPLLAAANHQGEPGRLAIVIDDLGYRSFPAGLDQLPAEISLSILPTTPYDQVIAEEATQQGRDIIIHMPMEPSGQAPLEPNTLLASMDKATYLAHIDTAIARLPQAIGMNNHMGSSLTANNERMDWLMQRLSLNGLSYLDSVTTVDSVAGSTAIAHQLPTLRRHIFLDHFQDEHFIRKQLALAETTANQHGFAVAIAHPHPLTLQVLATVLPTLNIELVKVSELWQQSLSQPDKRMPSPRPKP